jgi:hypothetical protein
MTGDNSDTKVAFFRDSTPLETDWDDLNAMLDDIRAFCKANPSHELLSADDPGTHYKPWRIPRIGFSAFRKPSIGTSSTSSGPSLFRR